MSSIIAIILFALWPSAHARDQGASDAFDMLINRGQWGADAAQDLDNTVLAKEEPEPKKVAPGVEYIPYKNKAYKNGVMGPDRLPEPASEVAKKAGLFDFDPNSFWKAASPRLIEPEVAMGEAGILGAKKALYSDGKTSDGKEGQKTKALGGAPVPRNPAMQQRGFSAPRPLMTGPRARAFQMRGPFTQTSADIMSIPVIGLFAGVGVTLVLYHLRSRTATSQ
jgi:hypothetical protein